MTARVLIVAAVLAAGCANPLPEAGSEAAMLYTRRCGGCHRLYRPELLTGPMWQAMVERMQIEMRRRGMQLSSSDRDAILAYLERNAGGR